MFLKDFNKKGCPPLEKATDIERLVFQLNGKHVRVNFLQSKDKKRQELLKRSNLRTGLALAERIQVQNG